MAASIKVSVYTNSDDAFVAWAPSEFIAGCRGFAVERQRADGTVDVLENRTGFERDNPQPGQHKLSTDWPFQRFNWTDHAVDVGARVKYRVTAMMAKAGGGLAKGVASEWTDWADLTADRGKGFSCFFNRGLVLSQFVARYMEMHNLTPAKFKAELKGGTDEFRQFLMGDLGKEVFSLLAKAKQDGDDVHAALYELDDDALETALIALKKNIHLVLSNGSDKSGDGNKKARGRLNGAGIKTVDRLLKSKGLGHNKFVVFGDDTVWTGSTNWSTTGLCTQINNGLLIKSPGVAKLYLKQWDLLKDASPPETDPANFTDELVESNDKPTHLKVNGVDVTIQFTRTDDGSDMDTLRGLINDAKDSVLFLMFTPGPTGLHTVAAERAKDRHMYVRGVVSTLGLDKESNQENVLDINLVSSDRTFKPDHYTVVQPQGGENDIGPWIKEVTRGTFLSQIGHAIVHSKVLVIDPFSDAPVMVTGSHNFSNSASSKNDENLVIIRGHKALAETYAVQVMSVYSHYRYRSYIREMLAQHKKPWSYLDDDDAWLREELRTKAQEINFWA